MNDADVEGDKYRRMWQYREYRKTAPGEKAVSEAWNMLHMTAGDSLIDFGCGTGRPAAAFQRAGVNVVGIDIAENCLDDGVEIPLVLSCLWDLPNMHADHGFCTDVMEHIPQHRVEKVLAEIRRTVDQCYFQIATRPDSCGRLIGETLHETVQPLSWWKMQLEKQWNEVEAWGDRTVRAVCR